MIIPKLEYNAIPEYLRYKTNNLENDKYKYNGSAHYDRVRLTTLFAFATQHLYLLKKNSHLIDKKIVVTGNVKNDGVGDYYHMTHAAEQIKKAYPNIKIDIIPIIDASPFPSLKLLDPSQFETLLCASKAIPEQALKKIREADLVLEVSYQISQSEKEYKNIIKGKPDENYKFIAEYAHSDSYSPSGEYACLSGMGVKNFELGIAIKDMPASKSLLDLENTSLKQILFNTAQPSKEDLANYLKNHEPFIAYLNTYSFYQIGLIYTIVALQENSPKAFIDICMPAVDLEVLDLDYLKNHRVGKISVIKNPNDNDVAGEQLKLAEEGKELRFINPYPLSQNDLYTFMLHSHPVVGCTGDHSLSEVLSFNRMPFYEMRQFKRNFWHDMIQLAGEVGGHSHYLQQYFKELGKLYDPQQESLIYQHRMIQSGKIGPSDKNYDTVLRTISFYKNCLEDSTIAQAGERMAKLLQTPEIYQEISQLSTLLKQQYNFNPILKDIVARKFALQAYPALQEYEKELYNQFIAEEIDIVAVNTLLKQKIDSITSTFC